jgi:hypothetical protein
MVVVAAVVFAPKILLISFESGEGSGKPETDRTIIIIFRSWRGVAWWKVEWGGVEGVEATQVVLANKKKKKKLSTQQFQTSAQSKKIKGRVCLHANPGTPHAHGLL